MRLTIKKLISDFWLYALTIILIVLPWFFKSGYLFFTDNVWGPNIKLDWTSSWFLFNLLTKSLSFIFKVAFLEKIFITGTLVLILLGGRALIKTILKYYNKPQSSLVFILSLFTLFNPYVYDRALYGQFGVLIAYGCLLFTLTYLFKAWQTKEFRNLYLAAVFTAIAIMFSVHFIFLLMPFYILFLINTYKYKNFYAALIVSILIILTINANLVIAVITQNSPLTNFVEIGITNQDLIAFATTGKNSTETLSNVLLMSGFWGKDQMRYLNLTDISGWQRSFILLFPIIIYGAYLSYKKNRTLTIGLIIIFSVAVILAIGIKSPVTSIITKFLYNYLPLYKGLREPQKWVAVLIPIYLFFLTLGASSLNAAKLIKSNRVLSGTILALIIIMGAPSLLWGFNRQVKSTNYPSDWIEVNNLLVNQAPQSYGCDDKILFLPWHMYMSFNWIGKVVANPASAYFTCPVIVGTNMEWGGIYDNSLSSEGAMIKNWLNSKGHTEIPKVRYIILAKELDFNSYLWINELSYTKPVTQTNTLFVYEIKP